MNPLRLARLNLIRSPFASVISVLALGAAFGLGGWALRYHQSVFDGLQRSDPGIEYVVGPKSSGLSVLLDGVFLAGRNLDVFAAHPLVDTIRRELDRPLVIPLAHFASFHGLPVVGTDPAFLQRQEGSSPPGIAEGRWFRQGSNEAVLGAESARPTGLSIGDTLSVEYRGLPERSGALTVVGILDAAFLPRDRGIYVDLEMARRYQERAVQAEVLGTLPPRGSAGATALWIALNPEAHGDPERLHRMVHVAANPQLIHVESELENVRRILGQGRQAALALGLLCAVLAMAATTLLFAERSEGLTRDLSLYRALGYNRFQIARMVVYESVCLAAGGVLAGLLLERLLSVTTRWIWDPPWLAIPAWPGAGLMVLAGAVALATLASTMIPLVRLYRWDAGGALQSH